MKRDNKGGEGGRRRARGVVRHAAAGFTLIELLVVCVIIGILAAMALSKIERSFAHARAAQSIANAKTVERAGWMYHAIKGQLPVIAGSTTLTSAAPFCDQIGSGRWTGGTTLCDYMKQWISQVPRNTACGTQPTFVWNSDPDATNDYPTSVDGGFHFQRCYGFVMLNCGGGSADAYFLDTGKQYYELGQTFDATTQPTTGPCGFN